MQREECDICGEPDDDGGNVMAGNCRECGALCCGGCLPGGVGTLCANCADDDEDEDDAT